MRSEAEAPNRPLDADVVELARPAGRWRIAQCRAKLAARAELPGAQVYDRAVQLLRRIRASQQVETEELLALACPASWLVNNRTPSPVFKLWLGAPHLERHWRALLEALDRVDVYVWATLSEERREMVAHHARALCIEGQGVAALSKVLAQLLPDLVPLMDDAALLFLLGPREGLPASPRAEQPSAGPELFVPMLDAFSAAVCAAEPSLARLAQFTRPRGLSPAQVLDRLLWMESWGWRLFGTARNSWWWIGDAHAARGERDAIVGLDAAPRPGAKPEARILLDDVPDEALRARLAAILDRVWLS